MYVSMLNSDYNVFDFNCRQWVAWLCYGSCGEQKDPEANGGGFAPVPRSKYDCFYPVAPQRSQETWAGYCFIQRFVSDNINLK